MFYDLSPIKFPSYLIPFSGNSLRVSHFDSLSIVSIVIPKISASVASVSSCRVFANSFFYRTHSSWNNLPFEVRDIQCPTKFKQKVTEILWTYASEHFLDNLDTPLTTLIIVCMMMEAKHSALYLAPNLRLKL